MKTTISLTTDFGNQDGFVGVMKGVIWGIAPLLVPVTMNAIIGSEDVANAMDLRCFGQAKRTWIYPLEYHWWDYVLIGFSALMLVGSILAVHVFHLGGFWTPEWFMSLFV